VSVAKRSQSRTAILVVEDHELVRAGLVRLLSDVPGFVVVAEAENCDEAVRVARKARPDVVLVDMSGLCLSALDGSRKFQRQLPDVKVVVMSVEPAAVIAERLVQTGVDACLSKRADESQLVEAIRCVRGGQRYLSDDIAQVLAARRLPGTRRSPFDKLTHRELQVLLLVIQGRSAAQIAKDLCLTQKTVNGYRNRVMAKLGARTDVELMHLAVQHGVIDLGPPH
jgi:two-component system invasion response regulator UvrY